MFSQGKKEFRNIKEENRQGFSFPLHPPPHPFHFPKVFSSPPTRIPRNTLIHTHTDIKKELKPHFSLGQIISASSPPGGGSLKKKMVVIAFLDKLWCGVGIETITTSHFHYLHKLIVDRSLNCCYQLCRFKTSPSITI